MKIINHKVVKLGSTGHNIITCFRINQIKKTKFEVNLYNKAVEDPYMIVVLVEAREKYIQNQLKEDTDRTMRYLARETIDLLNKRSDFDVSGVI